jgi:hypothetical protein
VVPKPHFTQVNNFFIMAPSKVKRGFLSPADVAVF